MSYILHQPICLPTRRNDTGNINIIKELRRIRRSNWRCPFLLLVGWEGKTRLKAFSTRKGSSLFLRLNSFIRMLPSKQNCMRLIGPDPKSLAR